MGNNKKSIKGEIFPTCAFTFLFLPELNNLTLLFNLSILNSGSLTKGTDTDLFAFPKAILNGKLHFW